MILNGGNYGSVEIDVRPGKTLVAINTKGTEEYWLYSSAIHLGTNTADFVGTCRTGDPRLVGRATQVEEM